MEILLKCVALWVIVFTLPQAGKALRLSFPATNPAPQLEIVKFFPGPVRSEDLSAWVLETHSEPAPALFSGSSTRTWRSVAGRNGNPLNMKLGSGTRQYVDIGVATISDILPKDGGRFLKFDSPETGFRAAVELLSTPPYDDLDLDRALRRWSNSGYAAEILAGTRLDAHTPVAYLGRDDLKTLLNAMAAAEGYQSSTIADEINTALKYRLRRSGIPRGVSRPDSRRPCQSAPLAARTAIEW